MKKTLLIFFITLSALGQMLAFSGITSTDVGVSSKFIEYDANIGHALCFATRAMGAAPQMHEFLADVEHLYVNFIPNGKGSKYFNWLNRQTAGTGNAADLATNNANTSLAEMYHTINQLRLKGLKEGDISQLGANYSTLPNSRQSDILLTDGTHIELKNKKYTKGTTPTAQEIDQVIGEKGALGNIDNLNKFEWQAAVWRGNNITEVKTMWKNVFDMRKTEIFEVMNPAIKNDLQLFTPDDLTTSKIDLIINKIVKVE